MKRIIVISPLIILFIICLFTLFYIIGNKDPNKPPSALLNKNLPSFTSKSLFDNEIILTDNDLRNKKIIINFFASWCTPCKIEHPLFFELAEQYPDLYILGFNHKDAAKDAKNYLKDEGNPYTFVGVDKDGLIALDFGVFGLPETFLINEKGKIVYKYMGPLTDKIIKDEIQPRL